MKKKTYIRPRTFQLAPMTECSFLAASGGDTPSARPTSTSGGISPSRRGDVGGATMAKGNSNGFNEW